MDDRMHYKKYLTRTGEEEEEEKTLAEGSVFRVQPCWWRKDGLALWIGVPATFM